MTKKVKTTVLLLTMAFVVAAISVAIVLDAKSTSNKLIKVIEEPNYSEAFKAHSKENIIYDILFKKNVIKAINEKIEKTEYNSTNYHLVDRDTIEEIEDIREMTAIFGLSECLTSKNEEYLSNIALLKTYITYYDDYNCYYRTKDYFKILEDIPETGNAIAIINWLSKTEESMRSVKLSLSDNRSELSTSLKNISDECLVACQYFEFGVKYESPMTVQQAGAMMATSYLHYWECVDDIINIENSVREIEGRIG